MKLPAVAIAAALACGIAPGLYPAVAVQWFGHLPRWSYPIPGRRFG